MSAILPASAVAAGLLLSSLPAVADPALAVTLSGSDDVEGACRLSFLVENRLGADLSALTFETVILAKDGTVALLTLFDFRDLPQGRPRVRQFDLSGQTCGGIGRILINGASACRGDGLAEGACIDGLKLDSLTGPELIG